MQNPCRRVPPGAYQHSDGLASCGRNEHQERQREASPPGPGHSQQLVADFPTHIRLPCELARIHSNLGRMLHRAGTTRTHARRPFSLEGAGTTGRRLSHPRRLNGSPGISRFQFATLLALDVNWTKLARPFDKPWKSRNRLAAEFPRRPDSASSWPPACSSLGFLLAAWEKSRRPRRCSAGCGLGKKLTADFPARPTIASHWPAVNLSWVSCWRREAVRRRQPTRLPASPG